MTKSLEPNARHPGQREPKKYETVTFASAAAEARKREATFSNTSSSRFVTRRAARKQSLGAAEQSISPERVTELLLITQYFDTLEKMAGQPPRAEAGRFTKPMLTRRLDHLSLPKKQYTPPDITRLPDFRGLIHADNQLALEKLLDRKSVV